MNTPSVVVYVPLTKKIRLISSHSCALFGMFMFLEATSECLFEAAHWQSRHSLHIMHIPNVEVYLNQIKIRWLALLASCVRGHQ